jgi:NAD(P)-dependent dehydrogenase (short-subunit alcohol dehydrogenase family)
MMQVDLSGKVAIVTGSGNLRGIGATYARALAEQGAAVVVADVNEAGAASVAEQLRSEGLSAVAQATDITNRESVQALMDRARTEFGGADILVNNAALMADMEMTPVYSYPYDEWQRVLGVNLTGAFNCCQAVVPLMQERGGGRIVNQSSGGAFPPQGVYGITKLGVVALTVALARELGPFNINVNAIAPGHVVTEASSKIAPEGSDFHTMIMNAAPRGGSRHPEALVGALLLLVSAEGEWMTGQTLNVDGGWVTRI